MSSLVLAIGHSETLFAREQSSESNPSADAVTIVEPQERLVSTFDLSVLRGDGIFEATTVYQGFPISLENHLRRLARSAALMDLPAPNLPAFTAAVKQVIRQYDGSQPAPLLRILVSRGLDPNTGYGQGRQRHPNVWIFLDGEQSRPGLDPISLTTLSRGYASDITAKAPWLLNGAKTLSYAINQSMHRECSRRGVDDAVTYTTDGFTLECPNSSIVAQYGDRFITPDPRIGILNGTTQRELFAWASQEGYAVGYEKLELPRLREADHLFMTHGGMVIPVNVLDGLRYAVEQRQVAAINDAIRSGRTHDTALSIGPTGEFEV